MTRFSFEQFFIAIRSKSKATMTFGQSAPFPTPEINQGLCFPKYRSPGGSASVVMRDPGGSIKSDLPFPLAETGFAPK
jgi:hypothetical protein